MVRASKFGCRYDEATRAFTGAMTTPDTAYVRSACGASLRRLGVDPIDVYLLQPDELPIEHADPIRWTLAELVAEGKIAS